MQTADMVEPEKHFLNKLIVRWDQLGWKLEHNIISGVSLPAKYRAIANFIARLPNGESTGDLKDIYEGAKKGNLIPTKAAMFAGQSNKKTYNDLSEVYAEITLYCASKYFRNFSFVKPKFGTDHLGVPE